MKITKERLHEAMLKQRMHSGNTDAKFNPPPKPEYASGNKRYPREEDDEDNEEGA